MTEPIVFGAAYSVYVRAVRLALVEKGVPYRLEEIDIFAEGGPPAIRTCRAGWKRWRIAPARRRPGQPRRRLEPPGLDRQIGARETGEA